MSQSQRYSTMVVIRPYDLLQRRCNVSPAYFPPPFLLPGSPQALDLLCQATGFHLHLPTASPIAHLPFKDLQSSSCQGRKERRNRPVRKATIFFSAIYLLSLDASLPLHLPHPINSTSLTLAQLIVGERRHTIHSKPLLPPGLCDHVLAHAPLSAEPLLQGRGNMHKDISLHQAHPEVPHAHLMTCAFD